MSKTFHTTYQGALSSKCVFLNYTFYWSRWSRSFLLNWDNCVIPMHSIPLCICIYMHVFWKFLVFYLHSTYKKKAGKWFINSPAITAHWHFSMFSVFFSFSAGIWKFSSIAWWIWYHKGKFLQHFLLFTTIQLGKPF